MSGFAQFDGRLGRRCGDEVLDLDRSLQRPALRGQPRRVGLHLELGKVRGKIRA